MYSNPYLHIQALVIVLLCLAPLGAYATFKNKKLSLIALFALAVWFLVFKLTEYIGSHRFPMDISALCYFLFSFSVLLPVRPLKAAAAQMGAFCGIVYGVVAFVAPKVVYARSPSEMSFYLGIVNHSLLLFGGVTMMGHIPFGKTDFLWTVGVIGAIIAIIEIGAAVGVAEGTAVFTKIVDGSIIQLAAPNFTPTWWYYMLYYPILFGVLALWIVISYEINRRACPTKQKIGFFAV